MSLRLAVAFLCGSCLFAAQTSATVAELLSTLRAALAKHDNDADLAKALHKLKPSERIDYRILDALETEGVGPKAYAELERLRAASLDLPGPAVNPVFDQDSMPSVEDQRRIVHDTQTIALNYAKSLPDFFCTEVIRRSDDARGMLELRDTLEVKLTYFEGKENYRVISINGRPTSKSMDEVGGAISQGEFASMLNSIFTGQSKAVLQWNHWTTVRGRVAHVYTFRIDVSNSSSVLQFRYNGRSRSNGVTVGQRGYVYIDRETNEVLRIVSEAAQIPRSFPVQQSSTVLDYDYVDVGGRKFLLPLRADVRLGARNLRTRNQVEFHGYRKFSGESTITFQ
jgi:hypothetical protein